MGKFLFRLLSAICLFVIVFILLKSPDFSLSSWKFWVIVALWGVSGWSNGIHDVLDMLDHGEVIINERNNDN